MSENESEIVDAEIVELPNLPPTVTYEGDSAMKAIAQERDWPQGPTAENRCIAHKKNGEQCRRHAIKGATVCRVHGGAAGHVRRAAKARLDNAADLMAQKLLGIAIDDSLPAETRLKAIKDALDRSMGRPTSTVEVGPIEPKQWEEIFDSIGGSPTRDYDAEHYAPPAMVGPIHESSSSGRQPWREEAESLEALRRSANTTGLGSDATGQFASSSPGGPRAAGDGSARQAGSHEFDREAHAQGAAARMSGPHDRPPLQRPATTGEAALAEHARLVREQRAIESPHKRYMRP